MDCGSCRRHNEPGAKFCSECGAPLATRCRSCSAEQPADAKFCNQCGSSIGPAASATETSPTRTLPPGQVAVRKNVTALFGDLVGSTSFGEQVDPEAARAVMAGYFAMLRSTIEGHAGSVAKFTGDGVMAVFGIPEVAEDDALRAVAAGLELQRRFRGFADSVREQHGIELGLRVGVNSGELVTGDGDDDLVGDVLNTAARLEAACRPGQVLVGEDTWRMTRSSFTYEVLGEVQVKGKADAIATFQVVHDAPRRRDDTTPFVGRVDELDVLREAFRAVTASMTARLVTVLGPPGVGKTRLAAELRAANEVRSFDLRFERRGSTTFTPIVELLREATGSGSVADVEHLVGDHPEADRLGLVLAAMLGHGEPRSTEESFWAARRLLEVLAADGPIVLVVDDIQWAEPLFWDLLDHLVEWVQAPVLLVALARPELRELRPELAQTGPRVFASVWLEGLDADTSRELAARLLDTDELPADLVERIPDSTEGNPLFIRELIQMLVADGVVVRDGDVWHLTVDVEAIEVPPTVLSLLASRVERLPDDERQVVELASVIGTEFDRGLLEAIAGGEVGARLDALIDRLRRRDLVEPSGTWVGDHPVYRFHHVLVRDAAYRRLLKANRAELHELVGRHLEEHGEHGDELDVTVAHHFEQVHRYRSELGTVDGVTIGLASRATARLRAAAEQALSREDLPSAGNYARRALALTDGIDERNELLLLGCEAFMSSGDVTNGAGLVDQLFESADNARLSAWADCFRAQLWSLTDPERLTEAAALAEDAAGRLAELDDQAGVAKARLVRAGTLARLGRVGDCEAELDLALGAARTVGDRRRTVSVLGAAPLAALWGPSTVARAGGRCLDVLRLLRITTTSPAVEATSIRCQGMLEALRGRFESAREKLETSRTTARDLGLRHGLYETEMFAGFVELLAGDPSAAEPHLVLARDGLGALGVGADASQAGALLGRSVLRQGRVEEAGHLAEESLASAGQNLQTAMASRSVLAEVRATQGRHDEARALIDEAIEIAERTDVVLDHAITLRSAARVAAAVGDERRRETWSARAATLLAEKGVIVDLLHVRDRPGDGDATRVGPTERPATESTVLSHPLETLTDQFVASFFGRGLEKIRGDVFEPGFLVEDRRSLVSFPTVDLDGWNERVRALDGDPPTIRRGPVLAVRRNAYLGTSVTQYPDGAENESIVVVVGGPTGRLSRIVVFDSEQCIDAVNELDDRWAELGEAPFLAGPGGETLRRARRAMATGDSAGLRACLADDFVAVDHRDLEVLGRRNADDWVATVVTSGEIPQYVPIPVEHLASDESALLLRQTIGFDGQRFESLTIVRQRDGLVTRLEHFEPTDELSARARYAQLTHSASAQPTNRASMLAEKMTAAFEARDAERLRELFEPEFRYVPRAAIWQGASVPEMVGDAFIASVLGVEETEAALDYTRTTLAVRGDDLYLGYGVAHFEENELAYLMVGEQRDGRFVRLTSFDGDDMGAALTELDRRYREVSGIDEASALHAGWVGLYATDASGFMNFQPGFELVDHRVLSGRFDRAEFPGALQPVGGIRRVEIPVMHRLSMRGLLYERVEVDENEVPAQAVWIALEFRDDQVIRMDTYERADLDAALARYDEILATRTAPENHPSPVDNDATAAISTWLTAMNAGDLEAVRATFHPEYRHDIHNALRLVASNDAEETLETLMRVIELGGTVTSEAVAVRGEQLVLIRLLMTFDDDEIENLLIARVADGLTMRAATFDLDQLDHALDELDRWFVELGAPPEPIAVATGFRHAWGNKDIDACRNGMRDDAVLVDRRRLGLGARTPDQWAASCRPLMDGEGTAHLIFRDFHRISDRAYLSRLWFESPVDGTSFDVLHLATIDADRLISRTEQFDLDDIDAALTRFDELAGTPGERDRTGARDDGAVATAHPARRSNTAARLTQMGFDAINSRDRRAYTELHTENFRAFDHMRFTISPGRVDRGVYVAEVFDDVELGEQITVQGSIIATRGDELCLVATSLQSRSDLLERLVVVEAAGQRISRNAWFEHDDIDAATDLLDAWIATRERTRTIADRQIEPNDTEGSTAYGNRAWDLFVEALEVADAGDRAQVERILNEDFVMRAHDCQNLIGSLDRDQYIEVLIDSATDSGRTPRLLAVRGDDLCLARGEASREGYERVRLVVVRSENGRGVSVDWFNEDQIVDAFDQLDRLWLETGGPAAIIESSRRGNEIFAGGTVDDLRRAVTDDFVAVDHRIMGLGRRQRDEWLATVTELVGHSIVRIVRYFDTRGRTALAHGTLAVQATGEVVLDGPSLVTVAEDGRFETLEFFDHDQIELARQRFAELAGGQSSGESWENEAFRLYLNISAAWEARDVTAARALLANEFVMTGRQPFRTGVRLEADGFVALIPSLEANPPGSRRTQRLVASRGPDRCLVRVDDGFGSDVIQMLCIVTAHEGRISQMVRFDVDQLTEALTELDRQWVDAGGPAGHVERMARVVAALRSRGRAALRDCFTDHFVSVDHRPLGMGRRSADDVVASAIIDDGSDHPGGLLFVQRWADTTDNTALVRIHIDQNDGSTWDQWVVARDDGSRYVSFDHYAANDYQAARDLFEELAAAETATTPMLSNRAWEAVRAANERFVDSGGSDAWADVLADDFVLAGRRGSAPHFDAGRDHWLASVRAWMESGLVDASIELLAVRGDNLCLFRSTMQLAAGTLEFLNTVEVDETGQCVFIMVHDPDQLGEAQIELTLRHLETLGYPRDHWLVGQAEIWYGGDAERQTAALHPDFMFRDHRTLGWPDAGLDDTTTNMHEFGAPTIMTPKIFRISERGWVVSRIETLEGNEIHDIVVQVLDGRVTRAIELFEPNQLDQALERFDELIAEQSTRPIASNEAWTVAQELLAALIALDRHRFTELVTDDFSARPAERLTPTVTNLNATLFFDRVVEFLESGDLVSDSHEMLALRGDDLCLLRSEYRFGDNIIERFVEVRTRNGRAQHITIFDDSQFEPAMAALDRTRSEPNRAWEIACSVNDAYLAGDRPTLARLIDPDGATEAHYRFSPAEGGTGRDFVELVLGDTADRPTRHAIELVATHGEHCCVATVDAWYGEDNLRFSLFVETNDEQIVRTTWYDVDHLDEALTELDRRVSAEFDGAAPEGHQAV